MMHDSSQIIIVANRLPITRNSNTDTGGEWKNSPGGMVPALLPTARERRVTWVGWPGETAQARVPKKFENISLRPVLLSQEEVIRYYLGFANSVLWPLAHSASDNVVYDESWWHSYVLVNQKFAREIALSAEQEATVWVNDYHLQLVPRILREARPDLKIGFFMHVPTIEPGELKNLPHANELYQGLSAAHLIGFQSEIDLQNFEAALEFLEIREEVSPRLGVFPVSIEPATFLAAQGAGNDVTSVTLSVPESRVADKSQKILLAVDRLDYAKGIIERMRAFQALLRSGTVSDEVFLYQVLVPTRQGVKAYDDLRVETDALTKEINSEFAKPGYLPIQNRFEELDTAELIDLYRRADVLIVSSIRDGMNLVAKEFVASRQDDYGVLLLSNRVGASHELKAAIGFDPLDGEDFMQSIKEALSQAPEKTLSDMQKLREVVFSHTASTWANAFLGELENASLVSRIDAISAASALNDPQRNSLYEFVSSRDEPVLADQAARELRIPLHRAKFHLNRLAKEGLLETEYKNLSGRKGPGSGRPSKLFKRSKREFMVSMPARNYDIAAKILARSVEDAVAGQDLTDALDKNAHMEGLLKAVGKKDVLTALNICGFEPEMTSEEILLRNCPFDSLSREHADVVCGLNKPFVQGLIDATPGSEARAILDKREGYCCVVVQKLEKKAL